MVGSRPTTRGFASSPVVLPKQASATKTINSTGCLRKTKKAFPSKIVRGPMSTSWLSKCCFIAAGLLLSQWTVDSAVAQWSPAAARPVRSLDRWLGIGYSSGYHWRNPGPNTDYYHPYSEPHTGYGSWDVPMNLNDPANSLPVEEPAPLEQPVGAKFTSPQAAPVNPTLRRSTGQGFSLWPDNVPRPDAATRPEVASPFSVKRNAMRENPTADRRR